MKTYFYKTSLILLSVIALGCSEDDVSDQFDDANGNVAKKLIQRIDVVSSDNPANNINVLLSYTNDRKLNTINNGSDTNIFIYDNNDNLTDITGVSSGGDNLDIEELYNSPYDASETGNVVEYDSNGNPAKIEFFEEEYDFSSNTTFLQIYTAELSYDDAPNPFFFTLESGGIIEVLDDVRLNFAMMPQAPDLVRAKMLLPVKNISQLIYKDESGNIVGTVNVNYTYDDDNYPSSAIVTAVDVEDGEQETLSVTFTYL